MIIVMAPDKTPKLPVPVKSLFMAGSIEMGKAEDWQTKLAKKLQDVDMIGYNPRRASWDSSWAQDPTPGTKFHEQVMWEQVHIDQSDLVVFYFDPKTQSPITLLELGTVLGAGRPAIVCCPEGYFRKGNVVITCERHDVPVLNTFEEFVKEIRKWIVDNKR